MRMWMIDPQLMCNKHLLNEHVGTHLLEDSVKKKRSIGALMERGQVDLSKVGERHDILATEMHDRGMNHQSPIDQGTDWSGGIVNEYDSVVELKSRCIDCRSRIVEAELALSSAMGTES